MRRCPACDTFKSRPFGRKGGFDLVVCERCRTLYAATLPPEGGAEDYDEYHTHERLAVPGFVKERFREIVDSFARYRSTGRFLDIGFGGGELLDAAASAGWAISGVEVSRPAVQDARSRGLDVFLGTVTDARYEAAAFDVVAGVEMLEHVPDPGGVVAEIARILRPGGLLWLTTPHAWGVSGRLIGRHWSVVNPSEHLQLFSHRGMREVLRPHGFAKVSIRSEGFNPYEVAEFYRSGRRTEPARSSDRVSSAYRLNASMMKSPGRRALKNGLNSVLSALHCGDSLKVLATR